MNWIAYTPIPYVQISSFLSLYSIVQHHYSKGIPLNLTYGIIMLLVISILCIAASVFVFKTRDINKLERVIGWRGNNTFLDSYKKKVADQAENNNENTN